MCDRMAIKLAQRVPGFGGDGEGGVSHTANRNTEYRYRKDSIKNIGMDTNTDMKTHANTGTSMDRFHHGAIT